MLNIKRVTTLLACAAVSCAIFAPSANAAGRTGTAADYGTGVTAGGYDRVVEITPQTKSVNVTNGQTVKFVIAGKTFSWNFDTFNYDNVFDLSRIAPADIRVDGVKVYIEPNPLYFGG
jgi:hypothetical protein